MIRKARAVAEMVVGVSFSLLLVMGFGNGCILADDVDNFDFKLPDKVFEIDVSNLGLSASTSITCSDVADTCATVSEGLVCDKQAGVCVLGEDAVFPSVDCSSQDLCSSFGEAVSCESGYCRASMPIQLSASVNLAEEVPELKDVGSLSFTDVSLESLYVDVEVNSLGVDIPAMDLYVADNSVSVVEVDADGVVTTPGVAHVGVVPMIPANQVGRYDVVLSDAGRASLTVRMKTPSVPFKFFVVGTIEVGPQDPMPNLDSGHLRAVVSGSASAQLAR